VPPPAHTGISFSLRLPHDRRVAELRRTPRRRSPRRAFSWDTHFGGSFTCWISSWARRATVDFQAVEGSEYRPFDPTRAITLSKRFVMARAGGGEIRRHLSSRVRI